MDRIALAHQVSLTLGDYAEDYDIDAIVEDLVQGHGPIENIDAVPGDAYQEIVRKHHRAA